VLTCCQVTEANGSSVQQQSAATAPARTSLHPTQYEPLTCASDLRRPLCLQMVRRGSPDAYTRQTARRTSPELSKITVESGAFGVLGLL
jgi:hypothetical protein